MSQNTLIDSLLPNIDGVLGIRDGIGAVLHTVGLITRSWSGEKPGLGTPVDTLKKITPTPAIKDYSHDLRIREGGGIREGDIILKGISKHQYPDEKMIDCSTTKKSIEKFYLIDDKLYTVINVKENYVTWDVQVRKYSNQARYGGGEI